MIAQQCAAKHFDAVETDNDEIWQSTTGFSITAANMDSYMTTLADYMHSLRLAWVIATSFCPADNAAGLNGELLDVNLDGATRVPCR